MTAANGAWALMTPFSCQLSDHGVEGEEPSGVSELKRLIRTIACSFMP